MRNIFDQYDQPENRVTHALVSALAADPALLRKFVIWATDSMLPLGRVQILEQSLPGQPAEPPEDESERRGLPDACIVGAAGWSLLIESKFAAKVSVDQLLRHLRTAERHGLGGCSLLLLTAIPPPSRLPDRVIARTWAQVYRWLIQRQRDSEWAQTCARYLEVAEARGSAAGYFTEGALTVFAGIPFDAENPYTYPQAKRILGVLREDLLKNRKLHRQLGADPDCGGRGAITGRSASGVWDFISLKSGGKREGAPFTKQPHLTLGISESSLAVSVTLPNAMLASSRAQVFSPDFEGFSQVIYRITKDLVRVLKKSPTAVPRITVVQRHYASQRASPTIDSRLEFDPRTALAAGGARGRVKAQPQWLLATYDSFTNRRSNLQFQIGAVFPYATCPQVRSPQISDLVAQVWLACSPIIRAANGSRPGPRRRAGRGPRETS